MIITSNRAGAISRLNELFIALSLILAAIYCSLNVDLVQAQVVEEQQDNEVVTTVAEAVAVVNRQSSIERLESLDEAIAKESKRLSELLAKRGKADASPELEAEIDEARADLNIVRKSFEQIAVGGISLDVFGVDEQPKDWQEELALVVQPLLENLRGLTEKPRKRENLKRIITEQETASLAAQKALTSIQRVLAEGHGESVAQQLEKVAEKWTRLQQEARRKRELALFELANLDGTDIHWFAAFKSSFFSFAKERGLTLLIALLVGALIVLFFRLVSSMIEYRRRNQKKTTTANRTAYRVIAYAQRLLTIVSVVVGILIVFFVRGDVLLLALMSILVFAAALGLRNLLPEFMQESRLLLNIGAVRENERVMIDGVPWRVASINMFTKLVNPEIRGILRLPLADLKSLKSRTIGNEKWFPSSIGDWVLDDDDKLYEVIEQSPDAVELQSAQGTNKLIPTGDYFAAGFVNLTKSKRIRITSVFGIDYSLQNIALEEVPVKFQEEVQAYLLDAGLGTDDITTRVEFKQANESSLDYLVIVSINSSASGNYYRIERYIQQACVKVCNREGWSIPFPQLSISRVEN